MHAALVDSALAAVGCSARRSRRRTPTGTSPRWPSRPSCSGVPRELVPASVAALGRYIGRVRPELRCTPAAAESMGYLLDPPGLDEEIAEIWQDIRDARGRLAARLGAGDVRLPAPPPLTPARRTEIRQALGVLDAVFLGEPGVLEARQRIAAADARARAAGHGPPTPGQEAWHAVAAVGRRPARRGGRAPLRRTPRGRRRRRRAALAAGGRAACGWSAGLAALRLAARGGARYASSAPRLFAPRASTGSSCATTSPCRPPRTSPPPWAR